MANRFKLTFLIAGSLYISIGIFLFIYEYLQASQLSKTVYFNVNFFFYLSLAAIFFAAISGGIASLIPTNNKVVFVVVGILPIFLSLWAFLASSWKY